MSKWIKITVILAVALIIFLVAKSRLKRNAAAKNNGIGDDPEAPNENTTTKNPPSNTGTIPKTPPKTTTGNGGSGSNTTTIPASFDPKDQAIKLKNLLANWLDADGQDEQAFKIINSYTTAQLLAVDKAWRQTYLVTNGYHTLYGAVDVEVVLGRASVREQKLNALKKMKALGLDKK
jgi:hypothetical protein